MLHLQLSLAISLCCAAVCPVVFCEYLLTSDVLVIEGHPCPVGVVTFTCVGRNLTGAGRDSVRWYLNEDQISRSSLATDHTYPEGVESTTPGVNITIVTVREGPSEGSVFVKTTLQTVLATLKPYSIGCGSIAASINKTIVTSRCGENTARVSVEPAAQICMVSGSTSFRCLIAPDSLPTSLPNVTWTVNDTAVGSFPGFTVQQGRDGSSQLQVVRCRAEWSDTRIQCMVRVADEVVSSNKAVLTVKSVGLPVLDFIESNWTYVVVILVIGVVIGLALVFVICCFCALCRCCLSDKAKKGTRAPQMGTQDPSFRNRSVGRGRGKTPQETPSQGATDKEGVPVDPSVQRNIDRMKQEAEEREDFLVAMRNLPDQYSTFVEKRPMGSRLQKYWGTVIDSDTEEEMVITRAPLSRSCRLAVESGAEHMETVKEILLLLRQNPQVHSVRDILPDRTKEGFVLIVKPPAKQSLRDLIHKNKDVYADWADKYTEVGTPLATESIRLYGKQILQAIIFLYDFGFSVLGHIQTGNIYVDTNVCQLGGYENTLLGYKSRLHNKVAEEGHLESIDVIMFGHVLYEMCTGKELLELAPSEQDYKLVEDERCRNLLSYIFKRKEDGTFKRTIKKISGHEFFKPAHASSNVRNLLNVVAGRSTEFATSGTFYDKLTSFTSKVLKGGDGSAEVKPAKGTSELKEMARDDDAATLLAYQQN